MTFRKGRRRKSTRFGIWSTWLMFGDLFAKKMKMQNWAVVFETGEVFFFTGSWRSNMLNMDAICRLCFELFRDNSDSSGCSSWGWAVIWWGCSPYPAHLHPNKNIWQDWHPTPARAYSHNPWRCSRNFFEGICWEMLTSGFEGCFGRLFIKSRCSANVERIWSTPEATASPPALAFRETN